MLSLNFNPDQNEIINSPNDMSIFLEGPYSSGKTTTSIARLMHLIEEGISPKQILILSPQRSLAEPYIRFFRNSLDFKGPLPTITTISSFAKKTIGLFWPLIAKISGYEDLSNPPYFLNMESSQIFMEKACSPFIAKGYFAEVHISTSRLFSQILDTLNKSALVGFPLTEVTLRLKNAWSGEVIRENHYEQSLECALAFRDFCYSNNLMDYSLAIETFRKHILFSSFFENYIDKNYQQIVADNVEEDIPLTHEMLLKFIENSKGVLTVMDSTGGYRTFLGADPISANRIKENSHKAVVFVDQFNTYKPISIFKKTFNGCLQKNLEKFELSKKKVFTLENPKFFPDMIREVADKVEKEIEEENILPQDIVILSPYLPDSLKFSLSRELNGRDIPFITTRPSQPLAREPICRTFCTIAKIAHPDWNMRISKEEFRNTIIESIPVCDFVRASLLSQNGLQSNGKITFFKDIPEFTRERISYQFGNRFDEILQWIREYTNQPPVPLDIFFARLFGEMLSQKGFGIHKNLEKANKINFLIRSSKELRELFSSMENYSLSYFGKAFLEFFDNELLPSKKEYTVGNEKAVKISPALSFLMENQSVKIQFWLDVGNIGWWERLDQPLTHPYVLSRNWNIEDKWTDSHEYYSNQQSLSRIISGLLDRCKNHVYMYSLGLNQAGINQHSPLLTTIQIFLKKMYKYQNNGTI